MIIGRDGPFRSDFLKSAATASAVTVPSRYIASRVRPCRLKIPATAIEGMKVPISRV
jgi:hypothetical protein